MLKIRKNLTDEQFRDMLVDDLFTTMLAYPENEIADNFGKATYKYLKNLIEDFVEGADKSMEYEFYVNSEQLEEVGYSENDIQENVMFKIDFVDSDKFEDIKKLNGIKVDYDRRRATHYFVSENVLVVEMGAGWSTMVLKK